MTETDPPPEPFEPGTKGRPSAAEGIAHDPAGIEVARSLVGRIRGRRSPKQQRVRPVPSARSGAHPDDRDPTRLGAALRRLVADHGWQADLGVHGVFARWGEIVGAEVAAHCTPQTCREGQLTISTDSTAWATQIRLLAPLVVRRLNEEVGPDTVTQIVVVAPAAPSWRKGYRTVRGGRGPRDTYG